MVIIIPATTGGRGERQAVTGEIHTTTQLATGGCRHFLPLSYPEGYPSLDSEAEQVRFIVAGGGHQHTELLGPGEKDVA